MVLDIAFNNVEIDENDIELIYDRYVDKTACCCGAIVKNTNLKRHEKSKRHIIYLDKLISKQRIIKQDNIILIE